MSTTLLKAVAISSLLLSTATLALADPPVITNATIDRHANTVAITGTGFGNIQLMSLTTPSLSVIPLTLVASSTTSINAALPGNTPQDSLAYGNYTLQITLSGTGTSSSSYQTLHFTITLSPPPPPPTTTLLFPLINSFSPFDTDVVIEAVTDGASGTCTIRQQ